MKKAVIRAALLQSLLICLLVSQAQIVAQTEKNPGIAVEEFSRGVSSFPNITLPYRERTLPPLKLDNTPRLGSLIRAGKLELGLADAIALALENNLDVAVQRFIPTFAQIDVLRTQSGQAARGFTGATIPGGLSSGALGAGVSGSGTGSGVGNAGGISGGGGAVTVGSTGNFDPSISFNFSWDRATSPLNTVRVSGVPVVTGTNAAFSTSYAQLFQEGGSYSLSLSGQRQSSTSQNLLFNPAAVTRFSLSFNQPLLNGFGFLPNQRFIRVARNNIKVSEEVFRQQVVTTIVQIQNAYWDLAALQKNVQVAQQSLAVAQRLFEDNKMRLDIGTMSALDVTSAEAEVAARTRDLTIATTNAQVQEALLKNLLSKKTAPELEASQIVVRDPMPEPQESDLPVLQTALDTAFEKRPELRQMQVNLQNQEIALKFTQNNMLPNVAVFGFYAGSGLRGNSATLESGLMDAFGQSFTGDFPEYAGGFSMNIPIKNRTAQADNLRSQLEGNQLKINIQRSRNQVTMEVRKAIIGLIQGKAQVEAAHQAMRLAQEIWEGEKNKLEAGASTSYQVILRERDFFAAQQADLAATVGYAKAMVELDRSLGSVLERNGIEYSDALSGMIGKMPVSPFTLRNSNREAK